MKDILLNIESKEKRCAILRHGRLVDLNIERNTSQQMTGNIYRGRVTNILHNIQSAFIDIGEGESGFIHISDIIENTQKFQEMFEMEFDWDYDLSAMDKKKVKATDISKLLKPDQTVLVQVVKEPIGSKGARLTSNISIPGRYLVLLPNAPHRGVSRKVQDRSARDRLKKIIRSFEMPKEMGLICRTSSVTAPTEALVEEAHALIETWNETVEKFGKQSKPARLYQESDLIKRSVLFAVDKKFDRMLVDDQKTFRICKTIYHKYRDEHPLNIEFYQDTVPMFERFGVENEIDKALHRKVWLPSGGYLFFEKTEAMTTIDVNSGRSLTKKGTLNIEESLVRINLEAADEMARQLRLRNVGGLIICDFIDMRSRKSQRRVLDHLKEAMKDDSAKCTILGMSEFGLVEMTRQRSREALYQTLFTECPYCNGRGMIKNFESTTIEIERALKKLMTHNKEDDLALVYHPELDKHFGKKEKDSLNKLAKKHKASLVMSTNNELHLNDFEIYSARDGEKLTT